VTIHVHGAGTVSEVINRTGGSRGLAGCTIGPDQKANATTTDCVMGTASGLWSFGDVVRLGESVDPTASARGWHFDHWTDSSASGYINCDPQESTGDFSSPNYYEFQIAQNLRVDLWFKDTTGPQDTAISGGPTQGATTGSTSAQFTSFSAASDPDATFQCRLDPPGSIGSYAGCPKNGATFNGLTQNGTWQLNVRAVDPSGNVDTTPAVRDWVVDTTPPVVHITSGPAVGATTNVHTADLGVSTSDGTLVCAVDGATLSTCTPPTAHLSGLADGQHTFSVRGVDAVGNLSTAITRRWTVDTTPPTVTVTGGPTGATNATSATFTVTTSGGTLACQLDGKDSPCAGSHDGLADGSHTFTALASDALGNSSAPVSRQWTVDTAAPDVTLVSGPAAGSTTTESTAAFSFTSNDAAATFQCRLDSAAFAACANPAGLVGLAAGAHTFSVRAVARRAMPRRRPRAPGLWPPRASRRARRRRRRRPRTPATAADRSRTRSRPAPSTSSSPPTVPRRRSSRSGSPA
jgi:hypothetical protein